MKQFMVQSIILLVLLIFVAFVVGALSVRQRTCAQENSTYIDYAAISDRLKRESVAAR